MYQLAFVLRGHSMQNMFSTLLIMLLVQCSAARSPSLKVDSQDLGFNIAGRRLLNSKRSTKSRSSMFGWQKIWGDEFETIDSRKWGLRLGDGCQHNNLCGWGNQELEYYTSNTRNVRTYAGKLVIEAREEHGAERAQVQQHCWDKCGQRCNTVSRLRSGSPELHQCVVACGQNRCPNVRFTSARLSTYGKFSIAPSDKYSTVRIEARISLTPGLGLWPAFWMLPLDKRYGEWPASGEIDIMESHSRMGAVNGTLHFGGTGDGAYRMISDTSSQITPGFHVYRVDWSAKEIRFYVDHKLFAQIPNTHWYTTGARSGETAAPFGKDNKFYILLNMAVGGAYPGYPTPDTVAAALATGPKRMVVDYVRVYGRPW